ncbi:hypothetical protein H4S14_001649 [Agrobacterium vitis]|nr:hypothetical protein [Agrobacterium vitis]MBE1437905.1 hypothetical protein [Agrobacterium vitis]
MTVKLIMCGRRRPGQTLREHRCHMKDIHGALLLDYIAREPENAPCGYVQNHAIDSTFASGDPAHEPLAFGFDFVTEVWFADLARAKASRETDYYRERLLPDEPKMVDTVRVLGLPYSETMIEPATIQPDAYKLFVVMGKDTVLAPETLSAARKDMPQTLGYSRNLALVPGPITAIDTFRFADLESAYSFADVYQPALSTQVEGQAAVMVIAKEYLLYPIR